VQDWILPTAIFLIAINLTVQTAFQILDYYAAGALAQTTPDIIDQLKELQPDFEQSMKELSPEELEARSKGGVNRSAAMRMKQFDEMMGEAMITQASPLLKVAMKFIPGIGEWIDENPDLLPIVLQKLEPFLAKLGGLPGASPTQINPKGNSPWG